MNHQITIMDDLEEEDDWEYLPDSPPLNDIVSLRSSSHPSLFNMDYFSDRPQFLPLQFPSSPTLLANDVVHRLVLQTSQQQQEEDQEEALMTMLHHQEVVDMNHNDPDAAANMVSFNKESTQSVDMNKFLDSTASPTPMMQKISLFDDLFNEGEILKTKSSDEPEVVKGAVNWIGEGIIGDEYVMVDDGGGLNLWKLGFGGIGAIGFAAATICLILFCGGNQKAKQSHKLRFQIYGADDQRMKQVVEQASKFNEAMSAAVRGVPLNRAHITYGGYYENSL